MKKRKMKSKKIFIIVSTVAVAAFYFGILIFQNSVQTQQSKFVNFKDEIFLKGLAIRDEEVLPKSENNNSIVLNFKSGEKVPKESVLAKIYSSPQEAEKAYNFNFLNDLIEKLENIPYSYGNGNLEKKIHLSIQKFKSANSINEKAQAKWHLWNFLNKSSMERGSKDYFEDMLKDLKLRQNNLNLSNSLDSIKVQSGGFFVDYIDGCENTVNYGEIPENFDIEKYQSKISNENVLGKIIKNDTWYILFSADDDNIRKIKNTENLSFSVPEKEYIGEVPCEIKSINKNLVLISCNYMSKQFASLRIENFKINAGNYFGIKFAKSALQKKDDKFGVYVKHAGYLKFKIVDLSLCEDDFVIAKYGPDYYDKEYYIQPGDKIVVNGKNLFDGKKVF